MENLLRKKILEKVPHFPHFLDERLMTGFNRLCANAPSDFLKIRSHKHLMYLILAQFFLQQRMEKALLESKSDQKPLFIKLFQTGSRICLAMTIHSSYFFNRDQWISLFHSLLPGIQTVPQSCFAWFHPDLDYHFFYFEVDKIRGEGVAKKDLKLLEKSLKEQLLALPPLTPAIFWPYNTEESFRQIQLLLREMENPDDLPHISILFQEQTPIALEFLIHYSRPQPSISIEQAIKQLPRSFDYFFRFKRKLTHPFPIEAGAFSVKVPASLFVVRGSINLLYARRYLSKYLEIIFGPFRDYNGGLFEKQQTHFEHLRVNLSSKIALFDLFAEKIFYALHPVEARIGLSLNDAERLFIAFSEILQKKENFCVVERDERTIVVKNGNRADWLAEFEENAQEITAHAYLSLGTADYFCCIGPNITSKVPPFLAKKNPVYKKSNTLKLRFQEGAPPSLNPQLSSGDMRCRMLLKLLFEGLMRLNGNGEPIPAGTVTYFSSPEGTHYLFKLRPCFWSNGERVTAIDYVSSWQRALRDPVSHPEQLFIIKNGKLYKEHKCEAEKLGIRALDAATLEIELERPDPYFLHKLAHPFYFPLLGSMREPKWFNGPYHIRSQSPEGMILEKNPYFWGIENSFFEQIEIKWIDDMTNIYKAFQEGKTDWIGDPLSPLSPNLIDKLQIEGHLKTRKVNRRFLLHYNTQLHQLSSPSIRQALSYSLKRSEICDIFPYSYPISIPVIHNKNPRELFDEGVKQLGYRRDTFPTITFTYSHHAGREKLALYLKETWEKQLGLKIELKQIEWNLFRNQLEKGKFEITATIQETLDNSPLEFLDRFEGANSWNFSQWKHPLYRKMLDRARASLSTEEKMSLQRKAEQILLNEMPFTPLFICTHLFAHRVDLQNYFFDSEGCVDFAQARFLVGE